MVACSLWHVGPVDNGEEMKSSVQPVLVSLVTYNDQHFLPRCLESLMEQTVPLRIKVFDNASEDRTVDIARKFQVELQVSRRNLGYSHGHNHNFRNESFDVVLLLNADVILRQNYLQFLIKVLDQVPGAGMAGGKLYRMDADGRKVFRGGYPVLDSTGIFFTPSQRHLDRGSEEKDQGQYNQRQIVFGITGASLLCKRGMLEDLRFGSNCLDEDFFVYREDADLAWRAQLRGWKAVYEPKAEALHYRHVLPFRRCDVPQLVNYHSVKNRYLMRIKNMDWSVRLRCFPYMWVRDIGILMYVLFFEWGSLPAYREVWRLRKRFQCKRKHIQNSRRISPDVVARWFAFTPKALDL